MAIDDHAGTGFQDAASILSALDSEQRLQIVRRLADRDHVVHELVSLIGKSQPLISQHLRVLKRSGLVTATRSGREVIYHLAVPEAADIITLADEVGRKASGTHTAETSAPPTAQVHELHPDHDSTPDSVTGGKAAIAGQYSDETLGDTGLTPELPHPPVPRIT